MKVTSFFRSKSIGALLRERAVSNALEREAPSDKHLYNANSHWRMSLIEMKSLPAIIFVIFANLTAKRSESHVAKTTTNLVDRLCSQASPFIRNRVAASLDLRQEFRGARSRAIFGVQGEP
jgi:hypothetical protein